MWDIKICCDSCYRDIFKAYFIVNDFDYTEQEDGIVFYADGLDNFFAVVNGLMIFIICIYLHLNMCSCCVKKRKAAV